MKKIIISIFSMSNILFYGCSGYYNNQIAYHNAQLESNLAYMKAIQQPLMNLKLPDGTIITVNNSNIQIPSVKQSKDPILDNIQKIINSTPASILSTGFAIKELLKNNISNSETNTYINTNNEKTNTSNISNTTKTNTNINESNEYNESNELNNNNGNDKTYKENNTDNEK